VDPRNGCWRWSLDASENVLTTRGVEAVFLVGDTKRLTILDTVAGLRIIRIMLARFLRSIHRAIFAAENPILASFSVGRPAQEKAIFRSSKWIDLATVQRTVQACSARLPGVCVQGRKHFLQRTSSAGAGSKLESATVGYSISSNNRANTQ